MTKTQEVQARRQLACKLLSRGCCAGLVKSVCGFTYAELRTLRDKLGLFQARARKLSTAPSDRHAYRLMCRLYTQYKSGELRGSNVDGHALLRAWDTVIAELGAFNSARLNINDFWKLLCTSQTH